MTKRKSVDVFTEWDAFMELRSAKLSKIEKNQSLTIQQADMIEIMGLGVALAVITTVAKLYTMKTKADAADRQVRALEEINKKLEQLDNRLGAIEGQLDAVMASLQNLAVKIDEIPVRVALAELRGRVATVVDNIERWADKPKEPNNLAQINANFSDISTNVRTMMSHGYAHCVDVFLGFLFELDLGVLLELEYKDIRRSLRRILTYLDDCRGIAVIGSIAARLVSVRAEINSLLAEDKALSRAKIYLGWEEWDNCCGDNLYMSSQYFCQLKGNILKSYSVRHFTKDTSYFCECRGKHSHSLDHNTREDEIIIATSNRAESSPERSGSVGFSTVRPCPINIGALKSKEVRYRQLKSMENILVKIRDKLEELEAAVNERKVWHKDVG